MPDFRSNISIYELSDSLIRIVDSIENINWNKAKEIWIIEVMKYSKNEKTISLFGSEVNMMFGFLIKNQLHQLIQLCESNCSKNKTILRNNSEFLFFNKINNNVSLHLGYFSNCVECKNSISTEIHFINNPIFIFVEAAHKNIFINDLPKVVEINNRLYQLLCATFHIHRGNGHFVGCFNFNNNFYIIDDLDQSLTYLPPFNELILGGKNKRLLYYYNTVFVTCTLYFSIN